MAIQSSSLSTGSSRNEVATGTMPSVVVRGFERIRAFVHDFNGSCEEAQALNADSIIEGLKKAGAVNDKILKTLTAANLAEATGLGAIVATALLKDLQASDAPIAARRVTRLAAQTIAVPDLFTQYDPNEVGSAVGGELLRLCQQHLGRNPRVITFGPDNKVDGKLSFKLFEDALKGDPDMELVTHEGKSYYTYRIGERPNDVVSIHPITGRNLRSNDIAEDGLNWSGVSADVRYLFRHAVRTGELNATLSRRDMVYYHTVACGEQGLSQLLIEFPQAARRFHEGQQIGQQPQIRRIRQHSGDPSAHLVESLSSRRDAH